MFPTSPTTSQPCSLLGYGNGVSCSQDCAPILERLHGGRVWALPHWQSRSSYIHHNVVLAILGVFVAQGHYRAAVAVSLMFHCITRPEESLSAQWPTFFTERLQYYVPLAGMPTPVGVHNIVKGKMRGLARHPLLQHCTILCPVLARFIISVRLALGVATFSDESIYMGTYNSFVALWKGALAQLCLTGLPLVPGGLRGGGAVEHYLTFNNIPWLRRRGRWRGETSLEHYLQESTYFLSTQTLPNTAMERVALFADFMNSLATASPQQLRNHLKA